MQQCMCAIVVPLGRPPLVRPTNPEKVTDRLIVCKVGSKITVAKPTPGEEFGGASAAPLNTALKLTGVAKTTGEPNNDRSNAKVDDSVNFFDPRWRLAGRSDL